MSTITQEQIETGIQEGTYRRMANGTIQDVATGRIVSGPPVPYITPENARQLHEIRKQKMLQATMRGIAEGASPDGRSSVRGWQAIITAMATLASDAEKGRQAVAAAEFLAKVTGLFADAGRNGSHTQETERGTVQVSIPADVALELARMAGELRRAAMANDTQNNPVTLDQRVVPGDYRDA